MDRSKSKTSSDAEIPWRYKMGRNSEVFRIRHESMQGEGQPKLNFAKIENYLRLLIKLLADFSVFLIEM